MAAIVANAGAFNTTAGAKTATLTPAVNELLVVVCAATGTTANPTVTDDNGSGTYTLIDGALKATSADKVFFFIRDSLIASAVSTIVTFTPSGDTGGGLTVYRVSGMSKAGAAASRQSGKQENQAAATPAVAMGAAFLTANLGLGVVFNATNPAGMTVPTGWTITGADQGYSGPATGWDRATRDSGETGSTITWGSASASAYCALVMELDTSAAASIESLIAADIFSSGE